MNAERPRDECLEDVCLTCGDIAVAATIVGLDGDDLALVRGSGDRTEQVSVALVDAGPGDTVLVHAGEAIGVIDRVSGARR